MPVGERPHPQLMFNAPFKNFTLEPELITQLKKFKVYDNFVFDGLGSLMHFYTICPATARESLQTLVDGLIEAV